MILKGGTGGSRGASKEPSSLLPKEERCSCTAAHPGQGTREDHDPGSPFAMSASSLSWSSVNSTMVVRQWGKLINFTQITTCTRRGQTVVKAAGRPHRALAALQGK